jgi:5-formyltetrahydrofolate cyclo-ligase
MVNLNNKEELRIYLKKIRDSLSTSRRKEASLAACQEVYDRVGKVKPVLSFAGFGSEIDLWDLNNQFILENRLVLPRRVGNALHLYAVQNKNELEKNSWGIYEPKTTCEVIMMNQMSVGLIPGLGFDKLTKHRLGYGKGFYDRLFSNERIENLWGIGFREQLVEGLPYTPFDVIMDEIYLF